MQNKGLQESLSWTFFSFNQLFAWNDVESIGLPKKKTIPRIFKISNRKKKYLSNFQKIYFWKFLTFFYVLGKQETYLTGHIQMNKFRKLTLDIPNKWLTHMTYRSVYESIG